MKCSNLFFKLALIFVSCSHASFAAESPENLNQFIPGEIPLQADLMVPTMSKEQANLLEKFQAGLKKDPEWAKEFLSSAQPGQPLPFHEKLGLTRDEYDRLQKGSDEISLKKAGTFELEFRPHGNGQVMLVTKEDSPINHIILSDQKVHTALGDLTTITPIHNTDPKAPTGPWQGIQWAMDTVNQQTLQGQAIKFCIGKLDNSDQGILYYDGKVLHGPDKPVESFSYVIFFPLKKK